MEAVKIVEGAIDIVRIASVRTGELVLLCEAVSL